ncbi:MAG: M4 family metallopeptidase [Lewinellaceae bacterium]|nr:M4 family metallopeptidase [Lewinellaceae bacterium]
MKKSFTALLCLLLLSSAMFAQVQKPELGTVHPALVKLPQKVSVDQTMPVLQNSLQMTGYDELRLFRTEQDQIGYTHEKFEQYYKGIKVDGATYTVHSKNGLTEMLSGDVRDVGDLNSIPSLPANAAFSQALAHVGASQYAWEDAVKAAFPEYQKPAGELVVVADAMAREPARLAWKFDVYATEPLYRAYVYIDAHTGNFIKENLRIHDTNTPATGNSQYNGNVSFTADYTGSNYRLRQTSSGQGVETYSLNNGTNYNNATDVTSSGTNFTGDNASVSAHWGAERTHSYYLSKHGRNSYDNAGSKLKSYVHYSNNYVNAFWDGTRMTYGDGDGTSYGPLVSLDICGHELTHGVTEFSAGLVYSYESGALNESFSDIFGETIENYAAGSNDWLMGDDIGIGGSGAFRNMANPNQFGDPDTYGGTNWYTGSGDNGGVHINSGVQNFWFYVLTVGKTGTNDLGNPYSVTGIGMTAAAAIAYRNLTVYLNSSSNYAAARAGAIQAAIDLYGAGSAQEIATTNAWYAVGVGAEYGAPASYCNSQGTNSSYEWVANVTVGTFNNSSGAAGYSNFTNQTITLAPGSSAAVSLSPGFSGATYNEYWKIWIDYNGDSDFSDAGELAYTSGGLSSSTVTGTINVPANASGTTRMRVSMKYNAAQTECETFSYGEVEDYTVEFNAGAPDTQAPTTPGSLSASGTTQTSTNLSWTASTDNVGVDHYELYVDVGYHRSKFSTSYTVSCPTAATTYSMQVKAFDAAGNSSAAASVNVTTLSAGGGGGGTTTILAHYFETGWDGWADGGSDCARYAGTRSWEGTYSIDLQDNSGTASAMTSPSYDVSGYAQLDIEFYFYAVSMESGEDFWVRYYNGSTWTTVAAYARGTSFNNNTFYVATVTLSAVDYNFPTNAQFRFQCDASDNNDDVYIDAITVTGTSGVNILAGTSSQSIRELGKLPEDPMNQSILADNDGSNVKLYPNPAAQFINIESVDAVRSVRVFNINGALMQSERSASSFNRVDVSNLTPGMYFISVETEKGTVQRKFIKG